jgi:predicted membrane-bound dolichyl-phosphate-mannose-protein mannosyltransferase
MFGYGVSALVICASLPYLVSRTIILVFGVTPVLKEANLASWELINTRLTLVKAASIWLYIVNHDDYGLTVETPPCVTVSVCTSH